MPISQSPWIRYVCAAFGAIFIGFGINVMVNPVSALSFFELSYPVLPGQRKLVDTLLAVYGYRDIFMGLAILAPSMYGSTKTLGLIMLAAASVAGIDGWACYSTVESGWMNHWGYAPMLAVVRAVLTAGI
ncbi:hypothetical protein Slin15195_G071540 [Septoria linicola]|uniref:Uncharacterized protein n=1 Tax=Septoria linicola TaxID=215465 RepID=A0A9Q9EK96_9PEZI|nr:hypothetical protein Slin14017_G104290 [Septoria linicola]USW53835.1 hypothetical protein Slin15195_G071540 [Septoria linicola]